MASDYAWGFATSREIKSWSPERAPDSNCEDQPDDDWDVASLPQLSFKPLPSVDVSTQVKWNDLADLNSQEADKLKITNTEQSVHEPFFCDMRHSLSTVSVRSERGSKGYAQLWLNQPGNANLFGVRLIGDARTPHLFSSLAPADLALYSEWGVRRVQQYNGTVPLELVLPVRTHPAILKEAVLGIHSGVMTLSWHTAEAVLVMANSIGLGLLEAACEDYFRCYGPQESVPMLSVAKLADHLGLTSLCKFAAEAIVQRPWEHGLSDLMAVHLLTPYEDNEQQWCELLHHPKRGAYTELQLLDFLKEYHICEQTIAGFLQMDQMHSSELKALLLILSSSDPQWTCPWHQGPLTVHRTTSGSRKGRGQFIDGSLCATPGRLLQKAVQQSFRPAVTQPSTAIEQHTQLFPSVMLPADGQDKTLDLDLSDVHKMKLVIQCRNVSEEGVPSYGLFIVPPTDVKVARFMQSFAFFSVHEQSPYVRFCTKCDPITFKVGKGLGHGEFLDCVRTAYPEGYTGPFTVGVWWQSQQPVATNSGA